MSLKQCLRFLLVFSFCLSACCKDSFQCGQIARKDKRPCVFIHRFSGYTVEPIPSGILVAFWGDGRVVRVAPDSQVSKRYVQGIVSETEINKVLSLVEKSGLLGGEEGKIIAVDAASDRLVVRFSDGVRVWAHCPGRGELKGIADITEYLMSLTLSDEHILEGTPYSGYPHEWYEGWNEN